MQLVSYVRFHNYCCLNFEIILIILYCLLCESSEGHPSAGSAVHKLGLVQMASRDLRWTDLCGNTMRLIRRITFLVFSGILIGCIILLPPEIVFL